MTVTVQLVPALVTSTADPVGLSRIDAATATVRVGRFIPRVSATVAWEYVIRDRDATLIRTMKSTDTAANAPLVAQSGQDPLPDVGTADIVIPVSSAVNADMIEDRFVHCYSRGARFASLIVGVPDLVLVGRTDADRLATYKCKTIMGLLDEGMVGPSNGWDVLPAGHDRIFDSSDPAYSAGGWDSPTEVMTVTAAQTGWDQIPFANGFGGVTTSGATPAGDLAQVIAGTTDAGTNYYRVDAFVAGGKYRGFVCADDNHGPVAVDGVRVIDQLITQFGTASQFDIELTSGTHTFWSLVQQSATSGGGSSGLGPTGFAFALCPVLPNDECDTPEVVSDSSWSVWNNPHATPGFTVGQIVKLCIDEAQARGKCLDIALPPGLEVEDAEGQEWPTTWTISTKSQTPLSSFFLRELGSTYADFEMVADEVNGGALLRVWQHDGRGVTTSVAYSAADLSSLTVDGAPTVATAFGMELHSKFHYVEVLPVSGHPPKEAPMATGASQTDAEADPVAASQLALFGRQQGKLTAQPLTGPTTSDSVFPGLAYWTGDTITVPVGVSYTATPTRVISMTWELNKDTGHLVWTPELGDPIVPVDARPALAMRKMTQALTGLSRAPHPASG